MKHIQVLGNFELVTLSDHPKNKEIIKVFEGTRRQIISVKLGGGEVLPRHKAAQPITVFCLAGVGVFRAGKDLEDAQELQPGTLITLDANIEHEVIAKPEIHILVTKFKEV